jgi:hypothetical protein
MVIFRLQRSRTCFAFTVIGRITEVKRMRFSCVSGFEGIMQIEETRQVSMNRGAD